MRPADTEYCARATESMRAEKALAVDNALDSVGCLGVERHNKLITMLSLKQRFCGCFVFSTILEIGPFTF